MIYICQSVSPLYSLKCQKIYISKQFSTFSALYLLQKGRYAASFYDMLFNYESAGHLTYAEQTRSSKSLLVYFPMLCPGKHFHPIYFRQASKFITISDSSSDRNYGTREPECSIQRKYNKRRNNVFRENILIAIIKKHKQKAKICKNVQY